MIETIVVALGWTVVIAVTAGLAILVASMIAEAASYAKRYCVSYSDSYTPMQFFWTLAGARRAARGVPGGIIYMRRRKRWIATR